MIPNTSDVIATFDNVAGEALLVSPASLDEQVDNSLAMVYTKYIHIGSYLLKLDLPQCPVSSTKLALSTMTFITTIHIIPL